MQGNPSQGIPFLQGGEDVKETSKIKRPPTVAVSIDDTWSNMYVLRGTGKVKIEGVFQGNLYIDGEVIVECDHVDGLVFVAGKSTFAADSVTALIADVHSRARVGSVTDDTNALGHSQVDIGWSGNIKAKHQARLRAGKCEGVVSLANDARACIEEAADYFSCCDNSIARIGIARGTVFAADESVVAGGACKAGVSRAGNAIIVMGKGSFSMQQRDSMVSFGDEAYLDCISSGVFAEWPLNARNLGLDPASESSTEGMQP